MSADHVVILLGGEHGEKLKETLEKYPHLNPFAEHGDFACLHCGETFPMSRCYPQRCDMVTVIQKEFMREHIGCKEGEPSKWSS